VGELFRAPFRGKRSIRAAQELQGYLQPRRRRRNGQEHVIGWRDQEDVVAHRGQKAIVVARTILRELA
jgi:hypothetical protein